MAKKPNAWMAHVMRTKAANPGMQLKDVLRKAGQTYKKDASASSTHKKHGGLIALPLFGGRKRRGGENLLTDAPLAENAAQPSAEQSSAEQSSAAQSSAELKNANEEVMAGGGKKSRRKRNKSSRKCKSKSKKSSRKSSRKRRAGFMID
jgi:hypothetical protein